MNAQKVLVVLVSLLAVVVLTTPSHALSNFTVQINGTTVPPLPTDPPNVVTISNADGSAKPYSCLTIAGTDATHPAQVVANDGAIDTLFLQNAVIQAQSNQVPCTGDIVFSGAFDQPPTAQAVPVTFTRTASNGTLMRGVLGAVGDWFKVDAWVDSTEVYGWEQKTVTCSTPSSCGSFTLTKSADWNPVSLTGTRQMQVESTFYVKQATDVLKLPLVQLGSSAGGGGNKDTPVVANDPSVTRGYDNVCASCCEACKGGKGVKGMKGKIK